MSDLIRDYVLTITCDSSGDATVTAADSIDGRYLESIEYVKGTLDNGATVTISLTGRPSAVDVTLLTLTSPTASAIYRVRCSEHGNTGSATSTSARYLLDGKLKVVVASGGNAGAGSVRFKFF